jgi:hypothetical protein
MADLNLTAKEAAALGIVAEAKKARKKGTRKAAPAKTAASNRCVTCGEVVKGETAAVRHMELTGHARFEMILETAAHPSDTTEP